MQGSQIICVGLAASRLLPMCPQIETNGDRSAYPKGGPRTTGLRHLFLFRSLSDFGGKGRAVGGVKNRYLCSCVTSTVGGAPLTFT